MTFEGGVLLMATGDHFLMRSSSFQEFCYHLGHHVIMRLKISDLSQLLMRTHDREFNNCWWHENYQLPCMQASFLPQYIQSLINELLINLKTKKWGQKTTTTIKYCGTETSYYLLYLPNTCLMQNLFFPTSHFWWKLVKVFFL